MDSVKKALLSRRGFRARTPLLRRPPAESSPVGLRELLDTGTHSQPWMLILDLKNVIREVELVDQIQPLLQHMEARDIVECLATSIDLYEQQSHRLYKIVSDNFAGHVSTHQLVEIVDSIDDVYRKITETINQRNKLKYANDSYQFESWLSPTEAVIASSTAQGLGSKAKRTHRYR